jgi:uncharacterized membrane protein required for colicin V production
MDLEHLKFNWVDLAVVSLLLVGLARGRKRGMSEEILDTFKWLLIVVAARYAYQPLGAILSQSTLFGALTCYLAVYIFVVIFFKMFFSFLKKRMGEKLVGSDLFGRGEYYLGMMAGMVRYSCIIIVGFALINARYYSPDELRANAAYQESNYGTSGLFPGLSSLQSEVFKGSFVGGVAQTYLADFLIKPTAPEDKPLGTHSIVRAREREVNEVLEKR